MTKHCHSERSEESRIAFLEEFAQRCFKGLALGSAFRCSAFFNMTDRVTLQVSRRATCQSGLASARELFMYASKIKETTNGSRSCPCREAWQKVEVVAKRRVAPNGQLDERKRATQNGEDKAQGKAHAQTHEKLEVVFAVQTVAPAEDSTCENQAEEPAYKKDIGRQSVILQGSRPALPPSPLSKVLSSPCLPR